MLDNTNSNFSIFCTNKMSGGIPIVKFQHIKIMMTTNADCAEQQVCLGDFLIPVHDYKHFFCNALGNRNNIP